MSSVIAAALSERVAVTENGQRRHISKLEASVKQLVNRAASGEFRATQLLSPWRKPMKAALPRRTSSAFRKTTPSS